LADGRGDAPETQEDAAPAVGRPPALDRLRPPSTLRALRRELARLEVFAAGEGQIKTTQGKFTVIATSPVWLRCDLLTDAHGKFVDNSFWDVYYGTYLQVFNAAGSEVDCLGPFDRAALYVLKNEAKHDVVCIEEMLGSKHCYALEVAGKSARLETLPAEQGQPSRQQEVALASLAQAQTDRLKHKPITKADRRAAFD
jgi:hypothetical protein